jgi:starch synthase
MRVLFVSSECAPLVKTGGLGDVSAALPEALAGTGVDVRVLLPGYPAVLDGVGRLTEVGRVSALAPRREAQLLSGTLPNDVPVIVVDCPELFRRSGGPYADETGLDWPDNARRFGLFSRVAALLATDQSPLDWRPGLVHCNDWQAGLAPAYLRFESGARTPSVVTIHNLAFQGNFDAAFLPELELPWESFAIEGLEFHGQLSFMKAGLYYADAITTVSRGYAEEIQTEAFGCGLHGLLHVRRDALLGIPNGIDIRTWDPLNDKLLPHRYSAKSLARKKRDKEALQKRMGLKIDAEIPLLGLVSRLTHQKGTDLVADAFAALASLPVQLAVLGSGEPAHERSLSALANEYPGQAAVQLGFDEPLAHLIEGGADLFLMPSRFEPCGMNQMYSQRYGTPPVAHATGGLADTIVDCTAETMAAGTASGFLFTPASVAALVEAVKRAVSVYRDKRAWAALQKSAMARDFSWDSAAGEYAALYRRLV